VNDDILESPENSPPPACEGCGKEAAAIIDGKGWCVDCYQDCYQERGSCCSGE
jgi:hypothetical protein